MGSNFPRQLSYDTLLFDCFTVKLTLIFITGVNMTLIALSFSPEMEEAILTGKDSD
jgi:hypothetical protein